MPCQEMKELELSFGKFNERRRRVSTIPVERRSSQGLVRPAGQARIALLMQMHRVRCSLCQCE